MSAEKKRLFMDLYQPVHSKFERFCRARAYGEMESKDLMQETIILAFEKFDQIQNKDAFLHFLFGISIRILANNARKMKAEHWSDVVLNEPSNANEAERNLEVEDLYKVIALLSESKREAIILFEISGFSIKEIAKIQNSSEDAVKQRLVRSRQELAQQLTEYSLQKA